MITYEEYLRKSAVGKDVIDAFLDDATLTWARFDPELGYTLGDSMPRDGLDGCSTFSSSQKNGARTAHVYADRPCRINTYGDSFTQCHQVSDAETWQEYLAAHLGEPLRNFGMGGFGFYQAYRRMRRTEQSKDAAKYVIQFIWGDDHCRSVMRCRHAAIYPWWDVAAGMFFHGNFWANIEMDLGSRKFVEKACLLPTRQSLYKMTDPDFMVEALQDDLMVQLYAVGRVDPSTLSFDRLEALADILGVEGIDTRTEETLRTSTQRLTNAYGFAATKHTLGLTRDFCDLHGKELLVVLLCPTATGQLLRGEPRYDKEIANFLVEKNYRHFDMNTVHLADFQSFSISVEEYMKRYFFAFYFMERYFFGHYTPGGNHFFAFALRSKLVEWLEPKPITYRDDESRIVDFRGYLRD